MARVIVILALMFLISAVIFGLTRKHPGDAGGLNADARATVPLGASAEKPAGSHEGSVQTGEASETKPAGAATAQEVMNGSVAGASPAFSTVGVDHRGRASFTGTASPGDEIAVTHEGKVLGTGRADKGGGWTVEFKVPTVREDYELAVVAKRATGVSVTGPQKAQVSPPETQGGLPRITLMPSEAKTEGAAEAAKSEPDVGIVVEHVVADGKGAAEISGKSDPGARVELQLNEKVVASALVASDGKWSAAVKNEGSTDASGLRVVLKNAEGKTLDSAELKVDLPSSKLKATGPAEPTGTAVAAKEKPAEVHVDKTSGRYVKVRKGDSLWRIAKRYYGDGRKWTRILKANRHKISDPDLIYRGRRLYLPG